MEALLWLLLFAFLFFLMMRYGCGRHMAHGRHGSHGERGDAQSGSKDPVCGMHVAPDQGYAMAWSGTTYRFCSRSCLEQFEAAPERFAVAGGSEK